MWLSFIIPLYNCGKYISVCLDSILSQGLAEKEYEVIIVNDGSTDNGVCIVSRYCSIHSNFRLINQKNEGVASARNLGLKAARGEYIHFMDPDDRLLPDGMRILYDTYLKGTAHPDMLTFEYCTVYGRYNAEVWEHIRSHKAIFQGTFGEYVRETGRIWRMCWQNLISLAFIQETHLKFPSYVMGEDLMFMIDLFLHTDAMIVASDLNIYRYNVRKGSALTRTDKDHVQKAFYGFIEMWIKLKAMRTVLPYDWELFDHFSTVHLKCSGFIRLLSAPFSYSDIKVMIKHAKSTGFYPIENPSIWILRSLNILVRFPWSVWIVSFLFRHIYAPYIRPWVRGF